MQEDNTVSGDLDALCQEIESGVAGRFYGAREARRQNTLRQTDGYAYVPLPAWYIPGEGLEDLAPDEEDAS